MVITADPHLLSPLGDLTHQDMWDDFVVERHVIVADRDYLRGLRYQCEEPPWI
jgi:hypothetical protein